VHRLITAREIFARGSGARTLVDVESLRAYRESLPMIAGPRRAIP
jgi:hypothetical protein